MTPAAFCVMIGIMWFLVVMGYFVGRNLSRQRILDLQETCIERGNLVLQERERNNELLDLLIVTRAAKESGKPLAVLNAIAPRMRHDPQEIRQLEPKVPDAEDYETSGTAGGETF